MQVNYRKTKGRDNIGIACLMMVLLVTACLPAKAAGTYQTGGPRPASPDRWEKDIQAFEEEDRKNPPPPDAILFMGSSSIRMWSTLAQDFPEVPVINRGFGGSEIADSTRYVDRIVRPYRPRMIVMYAGTNDIHNGKSPEQVRDDFRTFVRRAREAAPGVPIVFLAIKPTPARWSQQERVAEANRLIAEVARRGESLYYLDTERVLVGPDGQPLESLVAEDKLHFNAEGYRVWTSYLRPRLLRLYHRYDARQGKRDLWTDPSRRH